MWEQIKNKWKQMFDLYTPEPEEKEKENSNRQVRAPESNIEAKMAFHYPEEKPFRFPMIPDSPTKDREMPAYQRRERKNTEELLNRKKWEDDRKKQEAVTEKKKEMPKVPFQPTEVASPIYGYRPRKVKPEVNPIDIPAFERKADWKSGEKPAEEIKEKPNEQKENQAGEQTLSDNTDQEIQPISSPVVPNPARQNKSRDEEDKKTTSFTEYKEMKKQEQFDQSKKPDKKRTEKTAPFPEKSQKEVNKKADRSSETSKSGKKSVPFNVIMTPRDKKNRQQKPEPDQPADSGHKGPPVYLLNDSTGKTTEDREWVAEQIQVLETTLKHFHVRAKVVNAMSGPSVTRFEIQPEPGVKVSKIKNLSDDIKLNMAARDIRMEAPIPGKNTIGIEIPNPEPQAVGLQEIFESDQFKLDPSPLTVGLGLDIAGKPIVTNLKKMPHGLIAGATGSGKSVCINSILISLLYKSSHQDVKFLLIDPKMVELAPYNDLPHLVAPVITDVKAATSALKWAVNEMEDRYNKFVREGARDVERFNLKMVQQGREREKIPYLIIVIDELADLMMAAPQDVEDAICRIAQKARACGIHLLLATQRPSVDVITGLIKANVPTRIAFSVSSQVDSRTIIDSQGAEKLLGKGDMLFVENGSGQSVRIQGAFVSDEEIERVTAYVKKLAPPDYLFEQEQLLEQVQMEEEVDDLYDDAVDFIFNHNGASASLLQRRFKIGYNRAARLIDQLEANGIISEQKGSKQRDVLITARQWEETHVQD